MPAGHIVAARCDHFLRQDHGGGSEPLPMHPGVDSRSDPRGSHRLILQCRPARDRDHREPGAEPCVLGERGRMIEYVCLEYISGMSGLSGSTALRFLEHRASTIRAGGAARWPNGWRPGVIHPSLRSLQLLTGIALWPGSAAGDRCPVFKDVVAFWCLYKVICLSRQRAVRFPSPGFVRMFFTEFPLSDSGGVLCLQRQGFVGVGVKLDQ